MHVTWMTGRHGHLWRHGATNARLSFHPLSQGCLVFQSQMYFYHTKQKPFVDCSVYIDLTAIFFASSTGKTCLRNAPRVNSVKRKKHHTGTKIHTSCCSIHLYRGQIDNETERLGGGTQNSMQKASWNKNKKLFSSYNGKKIERQYFFGWIPCSFSPHQTRRGVRGQFCETKKEKQTNKQTNKKTKIKRTK